MAVEPEQDDLLLSENEAHNQRMARLAIDAMTRHKYTTRQIMCATLNSVTATINGRVASKGRITVGEIMQLIDSMFDDIRSQFSPAEEADENEEIAHNELMNDQTYRDDFYNRFPEGM